MWPHAHIDVTTFPICSNCSVVSACIVGLCYACGYTTTSVNLAILWGDIRTIFFLLSVGSLGGKKKPGSWRVHIYQVSLPREPETPPPGVYTSPRNYWCASYLEDKLFKLHTATITICMLRSSKKPVSWEVEHKK